MTAIHPKRALYIKLGRRGVWERDCIANDQLRFGHEEWPHDLALRRDWEGLTEWTLAKGKRKTVGPAKDTVRQIREFYTADVDVLWITFSGGRLWWTFAESEVKRLADGTKIRHARPAWTDRDTSGLPLLMRQLGGRLTRLAAYKGTICQVEDRKGLLDYLTRKINGRHSVAGERSQASLLALQADIKQAIRTLTWRDFETLIDLLAREGGWQRLDELGGQRKGIDLILRQPLTSEEMIVSVKSTIGKADFDAHLEALRDSYPEARHRVLAIHRPPRNARVPSGWTLWDADAVASMAVRLGLADWITERSL